MKAGTKRFLLVLCGVLVGLINGFLGAGGGIIVVPILAGILKLEQKEAHATAIFVILPLCVISGIIYLVLGNFSLRVFLPVLIGSLMGAVLGALLLSKLKNDVLIYVFCAALIFAGIRMILGGFSLV